MATLPALILRHKSEILEQVEREARRSAALRGLSGPEFGALAQGFLESLAEERRGSRFVPRRADEWIQRLRDGADLREALEELAIVRRVVARIGRQVGGTDSPPRGDWERLARRVERAMAQVSELFQRGAVIERNAEAALVAHLDRIAAMAGAAEPLRSADLERELRPIVRELRRSCDARALALVVRERGPRTVIVRVGDGDAVADAFAVAEGDGASIPHRVLGFPLAEGAALVGMLGVITEDGGPLSEGQRRRLGTLGDRVVASLNRAWLTRQLRHQNDQMAAERDMRERFTAILAHDLRGPLSTAKLSAQMVERFGDDSDRRETAMQRILRNLDRMDAMLRDLLDLSRLRAGQRLPIKVAPCDLEALAREVVEDLSLSYGDRFTLTSDGPLVGYWSSMELHRALWNLGVNAARYGATREPILVELQGDGRAVTIRVRNRGNPIDPVDQALLFDGFFRADAAEPEEGAWGLGLALVRACAEAHGGRAEVTSSPVEGTTFAMHLPVDARPHENEPAEGGTDQRSS